MPELESARSSPASPQAKPFIHAKTPSPDWPSSHGAGWKGHGSPADASAKQGLSGAHESGTDLSTVRDELAAINRTLSIMQDHLAALDARYERFSPWLRAASIARIGFQRLAALVCAPFKLLAPFLAWRETIRRIDDARFRSERLVFVTARNEFQRKVDVAAFARHLRRSFGISPPVIYRIEQRQRTALASRPRILHAIANVWVGGSTQLVVDLHNYLGHRFEMHVVTSALPLHGFHKGMSIDVVPACGPRHLVREIINQFRPHILHVHYWGSVDESWYRMIFESASQCGIPIVQNINTPVAPFDGVPISHNVFVSRSVLDQFGSTVPASVIHPGIALDSFGPPAVKDPHALNAVGMIYRLEQDKLDPAAIELFVAIAKRRPRTRVIIIGDGSLFGHFRARIEQEGLLRQFECTGYIPYEDLPGQLARFRTFVAPVWQESFGQVIPFAMAGGLAVAGYNVGAIPEILGGTETLGRTLDETASIVTALLDNPAKIAALGERNRTIALERFSVEDMAIRYFYLFRGLLPCETDILGGLPEAVHFPL